jgi:hypothetical protein
MNTSTSETQFGSALAELWSSISVVKSDPKSALQIHGSDKGQIVLTNINQQKAARKHWASLASFFEILLKHFVRIFQLRDTLSWQRQIGLPRDRA